MICIIVLLATPVFGLEFEAPAAPDTASEFMPQTSSNFAQDLIHVMKAAIAAVLPQMKEAMTVCLSVSAMFLLISLLQSFSGSSKRIVNLAGVLGVAILLLQPAAAFINLGADTIKELSEYGKLLMPVMAGALAAQGATGTSAALYMGTAVLDSVLMTFLSKLVMPIMYIYICLCIANSALQDQMIRNLKEFGKWLITWSLKTALYVFTGYMGITGVISGTADAAAVKAAKLTINSTVPVVGNILSDASEAILVSAGLMKNAAGIYGILAITAIFIGPFLKIGIQYLLLKFTAAVCGVIGPKELSGLVQDFSGSMGLILAMTGTVCLLLLISTVCFMKGVG